MGDDSGTAAVRADEIMASLSAMIEAGHPGVLDALSAGRAELEELATRFAGEYRLLPVLLCYRGIIHQELWGRLRDPADLDAVCELLTVAVASMPEPDPAVVYDLVEAAWDRHAQEPSPEARDTFITWATWLLGQPAARLSSPGGLFTDDYLVQLRTQVAFGLNDRADAGEGDQVADLTAAITHYEAVLAAHPAGDPERAEFLAFTVHAYWDLIAAGGSRVEWVDRMTRHAREAWAAPGLPEDSRAVIGLCLGLGLQEQFSRPGALPPVDLVQLAISALTEVLPELQAVEEDLSLLAETTLGVLLAGEGQLTGDLSSLVRAEPYLLHVASKVPVDDPNWSDVVRSLAGVAAVLAGAGFRLTHSDVAVRLLRSAAQRPPADPEQAALIDLALGSVLFTSAMGHRGPQADEGIRFMTAAFRKAPAASSYRLMIAWNLCSALGGRFLVVGNREDLQAAQFYLDYLDGTQSEVATGRLAQVMPDTDLLLTGVRGQLALARGSAEGDPDAFRVAVEHLRQAVRLAGPDHPLAGRLRGDLGLALLMHFGRTGEDLTELDQGIAELEAAAKLIPPGHLMRDMAMFRVAAASYLAGVARRDPDALRAGAARLRQVRADWVGGAGDPVRVTAMLAVTYGELWGMSGDPADLTAAREWYATASGELDGQPGHPSHGTVLIGRARLERRAGDIRAAVEAGLAALRARARDVLLQSGPAHGLATARVAAAEAAEVAGWCLGDGATTAAVEALELGRGLVLHAATSAADLPELLDAAGRADLAGEWRRQDGQRAVDEPWDGADRAQWASLLGGAALAVPSDLRERTLAALGGEAPVAPPTWREIADALARNGADALAYLLPPGGGDHGYALLVPANGEPRAVPLPGLRQETSHSLDEFAAAQAALLAAPAEREPDYEAAEGEWRARLGPLCDWAWTAVVGPLLGEVPRSVPGTAPRLVLVPTGRLGVVPWHAARRPDAESGSGWRYAIADAAFSYTASGRQLAEVSRRPALPLASDPVIAAPKNDLPSGPAEAAAIRGLYPGVRCLGAAFGGRELGTATPADVLGVLPAKAGAGASLLHLVCHGMATSAGADASCLELEDDGSPGPGHGGLLAVRAILRQAGGRPAAAPGGIVTLAACRTDLTAADHDEALTLATAFLAAGAVTVVGARWDLRDAQSPALMFMFHHYLVTEGRRPGDALRAAQLWMLDPDREWPATMPPGLRLEFGLEHVLAWAGLTHQGQ